MAGEVRAADVVALGSTADSVLATVSARVLPGDSLALTSTIHLQTATAAGYALNTVDADVSYRAGTTGVDLTVVQSSNERYAAAAIVVSLSAMQLQFDSLHTWQLLAPVRLVYSDSSIAVDSLSVDAAGGRIMAAGSLGGAPGDLLRLEIYGVEVGPLFAAAQTDLQMTGVLGAALTLKGGLRSPGIDGPLGFVDGSYAGNPLPEIHSILAMSDGVLTADLVASRPMGTAFVVGTATIPMTAGGTGATGAERPLAASVALNDLPLELVPNLTTQVSQMTGVVNGNFEVSGTTANPVMSGVVSVDSSSAVITALGIQVDDLDVRLTLDGDSLVVDSFTGRSGGPVRIEGSIGLAKLSEPTFDLLLTANEAYVLNDERGRLRADMNVHMRGPYLQTAIGGTIRILNGVVYIPEYSEKVVLDADDPIFLLVLDTADARTRELYQPPNPFMENLVMNIEVEVARDTWVRSADANIELFSDGPFRISTDRVRKRLAFEGVLSTERGQYTFLSKRFEIRRGSATFIGEQAGLNPTLQISGEHEVQLPASGAVQIRVNIGGTMVRPELQLESDARPPLSQSDMLSYLAFGQSSGSLLQTGASGLVPEGGIGGVGKVAGQQLQGIALGTLFDQLERQAEGAGMRSLGLDLLNITPAPTYTEIAKGDVLSFLQQTEFEAGRYVTPRTFVAGQLRLSATPGVRAVHRSPGGYRFEMTWEPRLLLREPTLSEQHSVTKRAFGLFLIREWRF
jgi:translocation and assembly module TamB